MTNDAPAPAEGPLSVDQAASLLTHGTADPPQSADQTAEDDDDFELLRANEAGDDADVQNPDDQGFEPPQFWDAEAKARFRELSPEHQRLVLTQAEKGVQASAKAIQEAAERAKSAEAQAQGVTALATELSEFLPQAVSTFRSRWDGLDWLQLSQTDPGEYVRLKAMHDAEHGDLQRLNAAKQTAHHEVHAAFVRTETAALATHAPDLADPVQGAVRRRNLGAWLKDQGASDEDLSGLSALAAGIAYDAMRYRRAKAGLAPQPKSKPAPARVVPPTAPAAIPQRREVDAATRRLSQTGRVEDAIALLQARRK